MATIVTRSGKGSPLTHTEMDANLNNMNDQKIELTSDTGSCVFPNGTTAQRDGSPQAGYSRFNTDTDSVEVYDGTAWVGFGGASAINELNDATVSASDPTITTNPIATGQLWVNKTSGECYICTDATTGANIWTNIGDGAGNIRPNDPPVITGLAVSPSLPSSLSSDTTTLLTWSGATDPDGNDANIVYSATAISDSNLTIAAPSGGTQGQLNLTVAAIGSDVSNVSFKIRVTDEYGNVVDSSTYTLNLLANQAPVITGLTVDTTALASYTWADINTGSTNTYTIAGATDPDGTDANIDYSIVNISNANLTASGGVDGADITLTVATIGADINGVTFNIRATDEAGGTTDSAQQSINLKAIVTYDVEYLVIAGGGSSGQMGGGGGAGGLRTSYGSTSGGGSSAESNLTFTGTTVYTATIGAGGASVTGTTTATNTGNPSSLSGTGLTTISSVGGGNGGSHDNVGHGSGGSGGGSSAGNQGNAGGAGTTNQGYAGGNSGEPMRLSNYPGGGGGGAASVGQSPSSNTSAGGDGGAGLQVNIDGNNYYWAGGGGGGAYTQTAGAGDGGIGGGGGGGSNGGPQGTGGGSAKNSGGDALNRYGGNGGSNTGGGGGGCGWSTYNSGSGGSGVVILRMATSDYSGTTTGSPAITTSGTDTIITFTGTGTYTA